MMSRRPPSGPNSADHDQRLGRLWTVRQTAEAWQISERTVRRMIADGRLSVVRLGRAVRIRGKAVAL
jgi:excisionase family DNA binding protein